MTLLCPHSHPIITLSTPSLCVFQALHCVLNFYFALLKNTVKNTPVNTHEFATRFRNWEMISFRVAFSGLCFLRLAEEHHADGKHFVQGPITSPLLWLSGKARQRQSLLDLGLTLSSLTAERQVMPQPVPGSRDPWCFANLCYPLHFKHKTKHLPFWNLYQRHFSCNPLTTFGTYGECESLKTVSA